MNKDEIMKAILVGFVVLVLVVGAVVIGYRKNTAPKLTLPEPTPVVPTPPAPVPPVVPPAPPAPDNKVYSISYQRGYRDGYSGAWLAPARWMVANEYRAGHHDGRQDRENKKPNKFNK